ncbi:hypothetical protein VTO73DRAFT_5063 [Trametes versicolor]
MSKIPSRPPFNDANPDIILRSADHVDFGLSKVLLAKISVVFHDMLAFPDVNADTGEPQIVELTEDAHTLAKLLRLCYPSPGIRRRPPVFDAFDELFAVLDLADKYDIEVPADATRRALQELVVKEGPARAYAVACLYEIPMLARRAARLLLKEPYFDVDTDTGPGDLPPELRSVSQEALDAFNNYRVKCADNITVSVLNTEREQLLVGGDAYEIFYPEEENITHVQGQWIWYRCKADSPRTSTESARVAARSNSSPRKPDVYIDPFYAQAMEKRIERAIDEIKLDLPFAVRPGAGRAWVPSR